MEKTDIKNFDLSIISDPHILDGSLIKNTENLRKELKVERKLVVESESLFKKALDLVDEKKSKFLILPGDMTKEGELISHKKAARLLKDWKAKDPERKIFILPGNHDIYSKKAYDFKKDEKTKATSPKDFLDVYDFIYEDEAVLDFYKDSDIFKAYLKKVNDEYTREEKYSYHAQGYLSYVARIKKEYKYDNGLTLIMIDSSIYSADREQNHRDGANNVVGSVNKDLLRWVADKIDEAKKRKDMVVAVAHHAFIPNFKNQELVFSPFIIREYNDKISDPDPRLDGKTPIEVLADMGVKFIFTGHLHENGTAKFISEEGNEIYDIQTGSTITYPLPIRHLRIDNKSGTSHGFEVYVTTELIEEFSYINADKELIEVEDASYHTLKDQLSLKEVIHNYIRIQANNPKLKNLDLKREIIDTINANLDLDIPYEGYMDDFIFPKTEDKFPMKRNFLGKIDLDKTKEGYEIIIRAIGNKIRIRSKDIEDSLDLIFRQMEEYILYPPLMIYFIEKILNKVFKMPIDDEGYSFYDFSNYIYQYRPTSERPAYIDHMIDRLNDPDFNIVDKLIDYAADEINEAFDYVTENIVFKKYGSKKRFYEDLFHTEGLTSNMAFKYLRFRVDNLRDLLDFFSRFITKKPHISGVDFSKRIVRARSFRRFKMDMSNKMFARRSLRKFITEMIGEMSEDMAKIYQNDEANELDYYFNYIEYDDSENKYK